MRVTRSRAESAPVILCKRCPAQEKWALHLLLHGSHLSYLPAAVWEQGELCRGSRPPPRGTGTCQYWFHHDLDADPKISKFPMTEPSRGPGRLAWQAARWAAGKVQARFLWPSACISSEMQKTELTLQKLFNFDESAKVLAGFVTCLQVNAG